MGKVPPAAAEGGRGGKARRTGTHVGTFRITLHVAVGVATRQRGEEEVVVSALQRESGPHGPIDSPANGDR